MPNHEQHTKLIPQAPKRGEMATNFVSRVLWSEEETCVGVFSAFGFNRNLRRDK
jgi:hypothetical protein